jgi:uncharacterized protein (DUF697 family)
MSRKLPKVIGRTMADMSRSTVGPGVIEVRESAARVARSTPSGTIVPGDAEGRGPTKRQPGSTAPNAIVRIAAVDPGIDPLPKPTGPDAILRRTRARAIVERHAAYSAVGGLIPLPILDVAGITAIVLRMVRVLSDHYRVPFDHHSARTIVIAIMGGAAPSGLAALLTSTVTRGVPGINIVSLAVSSIAAAACTRSIGQIFVDHFESGGTALDMKAPPK